MGFRGLGCLGFGGLGSEDFLLGLRVAVSLGRVAGWTRTGARPSHRGCARYQVDGDCRVRALGLRVQHNGGR